MQVPEPLKANIWLSLNLNPGYQRRVLYFNTLLNDNDYIIVKREGPGNGSHAHDMDFSFEGTVSSLSEDVIANDPENDHIYVNTYNNRTQVLLYQGKESDKFTMEYPYVTYCSVNGQEVILYSDGAE